VEVAIGSWYALGERSAKLADRQQKTKRRVALCVGVAPFAVGHASHEWQRNRPARSFEYFGTAKVSKPRAVPHGKPQRAGQ